MCKVAKKLIKHHQAQPLLCQKIYVLIIMARNCHLTSYNMVVIDFNDITPWASCQIRKIAGCACAGNAGNVFPSTDFKVYWLLAIPACITARASSTCRDACRDRLPAVTGKTFPAFPAHAHPQICVSGKRPMFGWQQRKHQTSASLALSKVADCLECKEHRFHFRWVWQLKSTQNQAKYLWFHMMTSSNGNIFRVAGHLCGEFTGPRWIPHTKASDAELWCFLWSAPN